jgi:rubrerythrin
MRRPTVSEPEYDMDDMSLVYVTQELRESRKRIAALEQERHEVRAHMGEALRTLGDEWAGRDEAELHRRLQPAADAALEREARLRAALEAVESVQSWTLNGASVCPWCFGLKDEEGHAPGCQRQQALARGDRP